MFTGLARECDNKHARRPWGCVGDKFATALEAVYPDALCVAMAKAVLFNCRFPATPAPKLDLQRPTVASRVRLQDRRVASGVQPRGDRAPRILPEFEKMLRIDTELVPQDNRAAPG